MQTIDDHVRWTGGYGLGLGLRRDGERILAGHGGSMPGFIAGVLVSPRGQGRRGRADELEQRPPSSELVL